ncbi:MAG: STAS domain-containing protein [Phycisphaerales bacterium]|nr:STAS domain-containing protein [Phycisphaerales bacterium]
MNHKRMKIDIEKIDDTVVIVLRSDVDMSQSITLREFLKPLLQTPSGKIIVDLTEVNYMDSSGLATLIEALQICKQYNTHFIICSLSVGVRSIIELARLDTIFDIRENREDALLA